MMVNGRGPSQPDERVGVMDAAVRGMAGVLLGAGVHPVDLVNALMGHAVSFVAMIEQPHLRAEVCENVAANFPRLVEANHAALVKLAGGVIGAGR
jgi:hypothetical protein